eukprot:scaffold26823_cov80-Skeletonema_dohrnii-CCMP3373.AAC.2
MRLRETKDVAKCYLDAAQAQKKRYDLLILPMPRESAFASEASFSSPASSSHGHLNLNQVSYFHTKDFLQLCRWEHSPSLALDDGIIFIFNLDDLDALGSDNVGVDDTPPSPSPSQRCHSIGVPRSRLPDDKTTAHRFCLWM